MSELRRIKTAVFGCGQISEVYLRNMINRFDVLEIVGCCSKNGSSAEKRAKQFGIKPMTEQEVLNDASIELVVNLTPATEHYDIIKKSLLAGKHVYTEKVVTTDYNKAEELLKLAVKKGLYVGCAPDTFLGSAIQSAKNAIDNGEIGELMSCSANLNRDVTCSYTPGRFTTQKGGGVGFDVGIYYITAMLSVLGPASKVCGFSVNTTPEYIVEDKNSEFYGQKCIIENENIMTANAIFKNGVIGTMHFCGRTIYPETPAIVFYGTKGIIVLPDPNCFGGKVMIMRKGESQYSELEQKYHFSDNSRGLGTAEMAYSIIEGRKPRTDISMAAHAVELLCAVVESSDTGITQTLTSEFEIPKGIKSIAQTDSEEDSIR